MNKTQVERVVIWSTVALVIPALGQLFVDGWNWGAGDFGFAWVFFNILGLSYTFVTSKITHRVGRVVAGILVILLFASIWVMLATG